MVDRETDIRRAASRVAGFFHTAPVAAVIVDRDGAIVERNRAFGPLVDRCAADAPPMERLRDIAALAGRDPDQAVWNQFVLRLRDSDSDHSLPAWRCGTGHAFWLGVDAPGVTADDDPSASGGRCVWFTDITDRVADDERRTLLSRMEGTVASAPTALDVMATAPAVRDVLDTAGIDYSAAVLHLADPQDGSDAVWALDVSTDGPGLPAADDDVRAVLARRFWRAQDVVYRRDLVAEDAYGERVGHAGDRPPVRSRIDVPFSTGSLTVDSLRPDAFSKAHIALLHGVASILSRAARRVDDLASLRSSRDSLADTTRLLRTFDEIGQALLGRLDLDSVLDGIGHEVLRGGIFPNVSIALVDRDAGHVEVVRSFVLVDDVVTPSNAASLGARYDLAEAGPYSEAAWTGAPRSVAPSAYPDHAAVVEGPAHVDVLIPVKKDRAPVALLCVTCPAADEERETARADALSPLLRLIAVALEHARFHRAMTESQEELRHVVSSARCLLWSGTVSERAGTYTWDLRPFDETAAQRVLPLDIPRGMRYADVWDAAVLEDDRDGMTSLGERALRENWPRYRNEFRCRSRRGELQWIAEDVIVRPLGLGRWEVIGVTTDITESKLAEERTRALNESLERRVAERTTELDDTNRALEAELTERRRLEADRSDLMQQVLTVQEDERARLARELHDHAGQALTSLLVGMRVIQGAASLEDARQRVAELRGLTEEALNEIRTLAFSLRPSALDHLGLVAALEQDCLRLGADDALTVDFHADEDTEDRIPSAAHAAAYRVVHAALTNVTLHAQARHVSVVINTHGERVGIVIEDDGVGFDVASVLSGPVENRFGLTAMAERLKPFNGTVRYESSAGAGATVFVQIPAASDGGTRRITGS